MDRRQTTILAADMVGYSRLMAADEEGVITRLRALRAELIDPAIAKHGGRIVKTMGDGLLVEFPSPLAATRMAIAMQEAMRDREAALPEAERMRFRIGINSGEVVIDGEDVLGDCVNIAARLESLAPPGGVCVGRSAQKEVAGKIDARLTPLGAQMVKNIPEPVEVWRVEIEGVAAPASRTAERPSIAVLPFDNMSADPDQQFLADGIVEDVITELSRFRWLLVIARNSTFSYQGAHRDVREIARELGVRYVVEGSVRRAGERLRISAQLIEAETGAHLWADRFDRVMSDLFDVQDEVTRAIVAAVEPELGAHERSLARRKPTESLNAWELYQRGLTGYIAMDEAGLQEARRCFEEASRADPGFSLAYSAAARIHAISIVFGHARDREAALAAGFAAANRALELDPRSDDAYRSLGFLETIAGRAGDAVETLSRGIALNGNNALLRFNRAQALLFERRWDGALEDLDVAFRLSPNDPLIWMFWFMRGIAFMARRSESDEDRAVSDFEAATKAPNAAWPTFFLLAAARLRRGEREKARRALDRARVMMPGLTFDLAMRSLPLPTLPDHVIDAAKALTGLGLPRE